MNHWLYFYSHLPEHIDPIFFSIGFFHVSWYAVMYLVAFGVVYFLIRQRIKKNEITNYQLSITNKYSSSNDKMYNLLLDFLLYAFIGLIISARLGEVFFYNFPYYAAHPLAIISPFDLSTGKFVGIYGMSYHGGLIGVIIASWIWSKKNKINLLNWANFIVPAVPAGYFFGRLGNFINGELYGRVTTGWWGMYFPGDATHELRHPSQLYEAFLEGMLLFVILWPIRNKNWAKNSMLSFYLFGYAATRIIAEFFRAPDGHNGFLTTGQLLSLLMAFASILVWLKTKNYAKIESKETK